MNANKHILVVLNYTLVSHQIHCCIQQCRKNQRIKVDFLFLLSFLFLGCCPHSLEERHRCSIPCEGHVITQTSL